MINNPKHMRQDNELLRHDEAAMKDMAAEMDGQSKTKKRVGWKFIALGQTVGILLGAGIAHVVKKQTTEGESVADHVDDHADTFAGLTDVSDSQTFEQALEEARETVGNEGAFSWRGGVYATCPQDEWMAKTETERELFTKSVSTDIPAEEIDVKPFATDDGDSDAMVIEVSDEQLPEVEQIQMADMQDDVVQMADMQDDVVQMTEMQDDVVQTAQADAVTLEDDGFIHVTDQDGHDFVFVNNELINVSDNDDVVLVGVSDDNSQEVSAFASIPDAGAHIVQVADDADVLVVDDDDVMNDGEVVDLDTGNPFAEPMAFPMAEDDMVDTFTEGFGDDGFMPLDVQPLENSLFDPNAVVEGPILDAQ